jgi:hypothetical protein
MAGVQRHAPGCSCCGGEPQYCETVLMPEPTWSPVTSIHCVYYETYAVGGTGTTHTYQIEADMVYDPGSFIRIPNAITNPNYKRPGYWRVTCIPYVVNDPETGVFRNQAITFFMLGGPIVAINPTRRRVGVVGIETWLEESGVPACQAKKDTTAVGFPTSASNSTTDGTVFSWYECSNVYGLYFTHIGTGTKINLIAPNIKMNE